jgi:hypothetical protein
MKNWKSGFVTTRRMSARTEKRTYLNTSRYLRANQHHRRRRLLALSIIAAGVRGERQIW